jgi:hypothetical protein
VALLDDPREVGDLDAEVDLVDESEAWPMRTWMWRTSAPFWSRCVA